MICPFLFTVKELYGTRYQSGSFSLINVGSGFYYLRSFSFLLGKPQTWLASYQLPLAYFLFLGCYIFKCQRRWDPWKGSKQALPNVSNRSACTQVAEKLIFATSTNTQLCSSGMTRLAFEMHIRGKGKDSFTDIIPVSHSHLHTQRPILVTHHHIHTWSGPCTKHRSDSGGADATRGLNTTTGYRLPRQRWEATIWQMQIRGTRWRGWPQVPEV